MNSELELSLEGGHPPTKTRTGIGKEPVGESDLNQGAGQVSFPLSADRPFLDPTEVLSIIDFWSRESALGGCNSDIHIVDPLAHYAHLDYVETFVIARSEYFRCSGTYDPRTEEYDFNFFMDSGGSEMIIEKIPGRLWQGIIRKPGLSHINRPCLGLQHLRISYAILSNVLEQLGILRGLSFCRDFYSILVRDHGKDVAELVKIRHSPLEALKSAIESLKEDITIRNENITDLLRSKIGSLCRNLLHSLRLPLDRAVQDDTDNILILLRMTVLILDLALVCYVGSHGSRFDSSALNATSDRIEIRCDSSTIQDVTCSLQPLACLGEFLDDATVWVFEHRDSGRQKPERQKINSIEQTSLSVLAEIDTFANVWGPVWPSGHGERVPQYNLSRGCIRPIIDAYHDLNSTSGHRVISCHWFQSVSEASYMREALFMQEGDYLLIGGRLRPNANCPYTLDHFESDFGHDMTDLGTRPECWQLDTRTLGLTAGQYINVSASGTQKRLPGITLKESIRNKMNYNPKNANIEWLNNYLGIEISPCTGHSRRVRFRELLCFARIQDRLEQYSPEWKQKQWGRSFWEALTATDFEPMRTLWRNQAMREPIANLLCQILELLHDTGQKGQHFVAAYFNNHLDKQVELKVLGNEWAKCLKDSHRTATYAVIGDTCLQCSQRIVWSAGRCRQQDTADTLLQTRIMFRDNRPPSVFDFIKLEPFDGMFRVVDFYVERWIVLSPVESRYMMRVRHPNIKVAVEITERLGHCNRREEIQALVKAITGSYGGMSSQRQLVALENQPLPAPNQPPQPGRDQNIQRAKQGKKRRKIPPSEPFCCLIQ